MRLRGGRREAERTKKGTLRGREAERFLSFLIRRNVFKTEIGLYTQLFPFMA